MHAVPMISRPHLTAAVNTALRRNPVAALLGPRQCGKTTLARAILQDKPDARYFDLEDPAVLQSLEQPATGVHAQDTFAYRGDRRVLRPTERPLPAQAASQCARCDRARQDPAQRDRYRERCDRDEQ